MSRRHTATSPEQRQLPRKGRTRIAVRLKLVDVITDEKGEPVYTQLEDEDGNVTRRRPPRQFRRQVGWDTRRTSTGRSKGSTPWMKGA